ncbi:MAG: prolipoprotein diacylglyceryl transferase [Planctomycetaceae bacterium]|nr:prolipoprotein diacylglyceryl transferase [Planctomycetaceae bacterium]
MRQTLIRLFLDEPWALWKVDPATGISGPGIGVVAAGAILIWTIVQLVQRRPLWARDNQTALALSGGLLLFLSPLAQAVARNAGLTSIPVFGYGFMLLIGFLAGLKFGERRAVRAGLESSVVFDMGFHLLIAGVVGARLFYLVQYADQVFQGKQGLQVVKAAINLSQGGLVLYGGLIGGAVAYFLFCYRRGIHPLMLADIATPSVFIGIGFGRIGCLLNGCCYGDRCDLPWAISFPHNSVPWVAMVKRGFLDPDSPFTFPLHPTQIYSALDGFLLAWVTAAFYTYRHRLTEDRQLTIKWGERSHAQDGETLALGCILYSMSRFMIEFLRGDEMGQLGTSLTISQIVSIGVLTVGLGLLVYLNLFQSPRSALTGSTSGLRRAP